MNNQVKSGLFQKWIVVLSTDFAMGAWVGALMLFVDSVFSNANLTGWTFMVAILWLVFAYICVNLAICLPNHVGITSTVGDINALASLAALVVTSIMAFFFLIMLM
jgi:hypothetical protein